MGFPTGRPAGAKVVQQRPRLAGTWQYIQQKDAQMEKQDQFYYLNL